MTKEKMEIVLDIIARGARLYYPDGGQALIGFGTEIRPNLFYWAQPFFESSDDLHLFRFNDINIAHRSGVEFLTDGKPFCLGVIDDYENEYPIIQAWLKEMPKWEKAWGLAVQEKMELDARFDEYNKRG